MKKIILAIGLMFGGVAFVNAQQTQQQDTTQTQQSDQYRSDTTSTDDSQNQQNQVQTQSDTTSTQQSDMYRTEGEGNVNDSTSNNTDANTTNDTDAASNQTTTGNESTTTGSESTNTGTPTTDDQMSSDQSGVSQDQEQEGEKIEVSELPAAVQTKLQSTDYQGWVVTSARKKMWSDPDNAQATSKEVYVIEAKNGSETKKLKFDKDGNEIEHDKHKKDDQK